MTTQTTHDVLGDGTVAELENALRGEVIRPGDDDYDEARAIWNGAHDRRPALIIRCAGTADVIRAVEFARSQDLPLAVRGGGHSIPGFSTVDGGVVVDLSPMNGVRVDPAAGRAVAGGGTTWADFDHETQAFGLATTGGLVSSTGIAGFTLGGGVGWLMRRHGLACDNLLAADVVTADGRLVRAGQGEGEDAELLWALRGGGGNFGVVTALEYALRPVGPIVLAGPVFYPAEQAGQVLRGWRDACPEMPDELTTFANLTTAPPVPFLPEEWHGRKIALILGVYSGSVEDGEAAAQPLRTLGDPITDLMGPMPYVAIQSLLDPLFGPGASNYMRSSFLEDLGDETLDTLVRLHGETPGDLCEIHLHQMGGAVGRVGAGDTAFGERGAPFLLNTLVRQEQPDGFERLVGWARDVGAAVSEWSAPTRYVNFMGEEATDGYAPGIRERLVAVKDRYDPANVFRLNQNVAPSGG